MKNEIIVLNQDITNMPLTGVVELFNVAIKSEAMLFRVDYLNGKTMICFFREENKKEEIDRILATLTPEQLDAVEKKYSNP